MAISKHASSVGPSVLLLSVLAAAMPAAVFAQSKAPEVPEASPDSTQIEQVVVTAQKRKERLVDVPLAITAVSEAQLLRMGLRSVDVLKYAIPELNYVAGPSPSFQIRGIGGQGFTKSSESAVSFVVDGIVRGSAVPSTSALFDIERVEVMSGPQGMLFGKNASAGLIHMITRSPTTKETSFDTRFEVGGLGHRLVQVTGNVPFSENAALRASAFVNKEGSYINNVFNGKVYGQELSRGGRVRFLWNPTRDLTVNLSGDYEERSATSTPWTVREATGFFATLQAACGITPSPENMSTCINGPNFAEKRDKGGSVQLDYRIGDYTITSLTGDRRFSDDGQGDSDTVNLNLVDINHAIGRIKQFSQELRLASPANQPLTYVAGLYYFDYTLDSSSDQAGSYGVPTLLAKGISASNYTFGPVKQRSVAAFTQGTWYVTPKFGVLLGARYTKDKLRSDATASINPQSGIYVPGISGAPGSNSATNNDDNFSYRAGVQYKLGPDGLAYSSFARGYKSAAIDNTQGLSGSRVIRPEIPTVLEFGLKNSFFGRRLVTDVSIHHTDFKDFQAQVISTVNGLTQFRTGNASHLYSNGIQVNVMVRPLPALRINGGVGYNDGKYGDFIVSCSPGAATPECISSGNNTMNIKGRQLALAPKLKANLSAVYDYSVSDNYTAFVSGDTNFRSRTVGTAPNPRTEIGGYALFNARLGIRSSDGKYSLEVYGKNLGDKRFPSLLFVDPILASQGIDQSYAREAFRTFGVALDIRL